MFGNPKGRATTEQRWMNDSQVMVTVTVHGWLWPSGGLWERNQEVVVYSPMLMMQGTTLRANPWCSVKTTTPAPAQR
jgi:hypothetical protein